MTQSGPVASISDVFDQVGKTATLRRLGGRAGIWFDVAVKAVERRYQPNEIAGGIIQGDREMKISDRDILERKWPGPPIQGDQIIIGGKTFTVQGVDSPTIGEETATHIMQVRG